MKNDMFFMPAIIMALTPMPALATAQTSPATSTLSASAEEFIRTGAKTVTQGCDLVFRKCGDEPLQTLEKGLAESNGETRTWRKMQLRSLRLTAVFAPADPTHALIETIRIDGPGWPIPQALEVGMPSEEVSTRLGLPNRKDGKCAVYFSDAQVASAMFCFQSGNISAITWEYFID